MNRENSNPSARIDNISTRHVEINERILKRCLDSFCRQWRLSRNDSSKILLLAAIRDARKCKKHGAFKPRLQPSYTVPPRPKPRTSIVRQRATLSGRYSEDLPAENEASTSHQSPKRPQRSQSRPQTPQKLLKTPRASQSLLFEPQTPHSVLPEQSSSRNEASGSPNAFLGISSLQPGTVQTSTPFKPGTSQMKPEISFQILLPSKNDQSQMRRIQCDHNLSIEEYEMIIDIVESFSDVDNLSNSLITVTKRNLSQIAPGKYELLKARKF